MHHFVLCSHSHNSQSPAILFGLPRNYAVAGFAGATVPLTPAASMYPMPAPKVSVQDRDKLYLLFDVSCTWNRLRIPGRS
jgi:hypothetical protein